MGRSLRPAACRDLAEHLEFEKRAKPSNLTDMMGHSKLTTTERYLHSKPRPDDVAKLTATFEP